MDEEFIRQKVDEFMCDVDSGDEVANHKFLHDFAKQLLIRQPVQVDEAIQDIAKFYLPGKTVGELLILELEQIGKRLYKNGDTVGARTIRKAIELLTQKRTVTREEIEELVMKWMGLLRPDKMYDVLKEWLKERGLEVVTKK